MSDVKVLTKEIAGEFWADEDSVDLSEFTAIEDAAAESLSKHEGYLNLDGLTELSDAAAESFSKHEGELELNGLTELSDAAAESLGKHKGDLYLRGLTELSDAAAESLCKHEGSLHLGVADMTGKAVDHLLSTHLTLDGNCRLHRGSWIVDALNGSVDATTVLGITAIVEDGDQEGGVHLLKFASHKNSATACHWLSKMTGVKETTHCATCRHCGCEFQIEFRSSDFDEWESGDTLIQYAMPYLSDDERELLMTETCGTCFSDDDEFGYFDED